MATEIHTPSASPPRSAIIYAAVLLAALAMVALGAAIWLSTANSGTNVLATDEKAISRAP